MAPTGRCSRTPVGIIWAMANVADRPTDTPTHVRKFCLTKKKSTLSKGSEIAGKC